MLRAKRGICHLFLLVVRVCPVLISRWEYGMQFEHVTQHVPPELSLECCVTSPVDIRWTVTPM